MTGQAMNCGCRKLTLIDLKSAVFAPVDCVWAYESSCFAIRVGAKGADFCTSIDFWEARQNSRPETAGMARLPAAPAMTPTLPTRFTRLSTHSSRLAKWVLSKMSPTGQSKTRYEIHGRCAKATGKQGILRIFERDKIRGFVRSNRVGHFVVKTIETDASARQHSWNRHTRRGPGVPRSELAVHRPGSARQAVRAIRSAKSSLPPGWQRSTAWSAAWSASFGSSVRDVSNSCEKGYTVCYPKILV